MNGKSIDGLNPTRLARDVGGAADVESVDGLAGPAADGRVEVRHGDLGDVERESVGSDDAVVVDAVGAVVHAAPVPLALVLVLGKDLLSRKE